MKGNNKTEKIIWTKPKNKKLVAAFLSLSTTKQTEDFLIDIMTPKEILEFSNRLCAAQMLLDKNIYTNIEKETGLSSTTVARVSKWLNRKGGGYKQVLTNLDHHQRAKKLQSDLS